MLLNRMDCPKVHLLPKLSQRIDIQGYELHRLLHKLEESIIYVLSVRKDISSVPQLAEDFLEGIVRRVVQPNSHIRICLRHFHESIRIDCYAVLMLDAGQELFIACGYLHHVSIVVQVVILAVPELIESLRQKG